MARIEVQTRCMAIVLERWTLEVPDDILAEIREDPGRALDHLDDYTVDVENEDVMNEGDHDLVTVTVVKP